MTTLKDVGRHAGVSASTVSLVLNDRDSGRVKPEISKRVRQAAVDLGYRPNLVARSLKTNQTHTIGLLSDQVASTPFAGRMLQGAQQTAWDAGYLLMLIDTAGNDALEEPAVQALLQRNMDGLIYASTYHREVALPRVPTTTPFLLLDGRPAGDERVDWVAPDEQGGAESAVRLLLKAGHRRIGFINSGEAIPAAEGRLRGYVAAIREGGSEVDPSLTVTLADRSMSAIEAASLEMLERSDRPSAVFCFNDRVAAGVLRAAAQAGIAVPRELSVVGFDNDESIIEHLTPGLTTVALPHREMGEWATTRLIERIKAGPAGLPAMSLLMPCALVERASVAPPG